jgi:hypothetical protein
VLGYDTGVISGALVTIRGDLGPATLSNGQKVSCINLPVVELAGERKEVNDYVLLADLVVLSLLVWSMLSAVRVCV